jgi:hypothetical protein
VSDKRDPFGLLPIRRGDKNLSVCGGELDISVDYDDVDMDTVLVNTKRMVATLNLAWGFTDPEFSGEMHPDWKNASREKLLEQVAFQGAMIKALLGYQERAVKAEAEIESYRAQNRAE